MGRCRTPVDSARTLDRLRAWRNSLRRVRIYYRAKGQRRRDQGFVPPVYVDRQSQELILLVPWKSYTF